MVQVDLEGLEGEVERTIQESLHEFAYTCF